MRTEFPGVSRTSLGPSAGSRLPKPTVSVQEAIKQINARVIDRTHLFVPPKVQAHIAPGAANNTVPGPASIAELARALSNNPDLIFEWVYNNIEFTSTFGEAKGALGCLIDGNGNNFDQCELLSALFTAAGLSPSYVFGNLQLSAAQANGWLGTDPTDTGCDLAFGVLNDGGVPVQFAEDGEGNTQLFFPYLWVQVVISGTTYVFDPSFKQYTSTTAINLATATAFNETTFISDSESGATINSGYVQNLNRTNLRADLTTYATNLQNYIKTNSPTASTGAIYGGRAIVPLTAPLRLTSLPYEAPGDSPTIWTSIPDNYRCVYDVTFSNFTASFYGSDVHGQQLTLFYNSSIEPVLTLNGTVVATGYANTPNGNVEIDIYHPYLTDFANQTVYMPITMPVTGYETYYMLGVAFGIMNKSTVDYWQNILSLAQAAGGAPLSEPVLGANLALLYYAREAQSCACGALIASMNGSSFMQHHESGYTTWNTQSSFPTGTGAAGFGIYSTISYVVPLGYASPDQAASVALGAFTNALEQLTIQQICGNDAVATPRIIDVANSQGTKLYLVTPANQGTVLPLLSGYSSLAVAAYTDDLNAGDNLIIPQTSPQISGFLNGGGWVTQYEGEVGGRISDVTVTPGGSNTTPGKPPIGKPKPKVGTDPKKGDPINFRTGDYLYSSRDLLLGSSTFPYQLSFEKIYSSRLRSQNGVMGLGWTHNWIATATIGNDLFRNLGSLSPIEASVTAAAFYAATALANDATYPLDKTVLMELIADWWTDQLTGNSLSVSLPDGDYIFVKLAGGVFNPQLLDTSSAVVNVGGTFTHVTKEKVTRNFNSSGQLTSIVFPFGVTVTLTYTSGNLTSISNGLGRQLTLVYTSGQLTSVTDGTGRSISYTYDSNDDLSTYVDANGKTTSFSYDVPGRMTKIFYPANPTVAFVTSVYDTLGRIKTQADALGNTYTYLFAGSQSSEVDPAGNSTTSYFDQFNNQTKVVDALGNATSFNYDGLSRLLGQTMPEGNKVTYTYDAKNNVLTKTMNPKPGSSLTAIVNTFTYDANWNKVHTAEDGRSNTTTYNYDPTYSNLLTVLRPVIGGVTPTITNTWSSRGQILTAEDETGVVTKYTYSTTNETLLTKVVDYSTSSGHLNLTTQYGYNSVGDINSITDPNTNVTTKVFDSKRRLTQVTLPSPFSYVTNISYDYNDNRTQVQRQTGGTPAYQTYAYTYNYANQILTVTDPATDVTTYTYNNLRLYASSKDALNQTTQYAYDQRHKLFTITDPSSTVCETRLYSNNGLLASIKDARSNTTQYSYDGFDRLNETIYPDTSYEQNESYDANGNVLTFRTRSGSTIVNTYDVLNRLSTKAPASQPTVTYGYDLAGRLTSASKPVVSGDPSSGNFQKFYDTAGRFYKEEYPDSKIVTSVLDSNGNQTKLTYADGYYVSRVYDQLNRLTDVKLNGGTTSAAHFAYDELSRRTTLTYSNGASVTYGYASTIVDDLTSIAHAFVGSSVTFSYGYNNDHQIDSFEVTDSTYMWYPTSAGTVTYGTANSVNNYPTVGGVSYSYNTNACLSGNGIWTYTYDTENHLTAASETGTSASYVYDGLHRQIQKTVGSTKSYYIYSGWQRIADYAGQGGALQNRYVYGTHMDEALIQVTSANVLTFYHANHQGSIAGVSNSSGAVADKNVFGPFGETAVLSGTTFGFTGQRFDAETGLYYFKRRYYSPQIGRFLQPDPMRYTDMLDLYAYADNDPLNKADELGELTSSGQFDIDIQSMMFPPINPHHHDDEITTPDCSQPDCLPGVSEPDGDPCPPDDTDTCLSKELPCVSVDIPCPISFFPADCEKDPEPPKK